MDEVTPFDFFGLRNGSLQTSDITAKQTTHSEHGVFSPSSLQISIHRPSCFNGCVVKFCVWPPFNISPFDFPRIFAWEKEVSWLAYVFVSSRPRWKVASFLLAGGGQLQLWCFGGAHGSCSVPCLAHKRRGGDRDGHGRQWEMGDGGTLLDWVSWGTSKISLKLPTPRETEETDVSWNFSEACVFSVTEFCEKDSTFPVEAAVEASDARD